MKIKVLVTGGTFDKEYDEINGKLYFNKTHVNEMLALGRSTVECDVETLMMIDSLDMTDAHRQQVVDSCKKSEQGNIVITHGTDTMELTARALADANIDKTIVLTGALIPYKFNSSDGIFNLGSAIAFAQVLPSGVYVAMNGMYFSASKVKKNKTTGFFEKI